MKINNNSKKTEKSHESIFTGYFFGVSCPLKII